MAGLPTPDILRFDGDLLPWWPERDAHAYPDSWERHDDGRVRCVAYMRDRWTGWYGWWRSDWVREDEPCPPLRWLLVDWQYGEERVPTRVPRRKKKKYKRRRKAEAA